MAGVSSAISVGLTVAATTWVMGRIVADARRVPEPAADGSVELRYGPLIRFAGVACTVLGVAFLVGLLTAAQPRDRMVFLAAFALAGPGGLWMVLAGWRESLVVRRDGVVERTMWGGRRELAWDAVRAVRFSSLMGYAILEGSEGRVRASVMMRGVGHFWDAVATHLPQPMWADARRKYDAYVQQPAREPRDGGSARSAR